jgi:drug/metabolite transporter (DMT)-like permease
MLRRIGVFFMLVGILILFLFFASDRTSSQSLTFLCAGSALSLTGGMLWYRGRDRTPAERFRTLRKYSSKKKKEDDKNKDVEN